MKKKILIVSNVTAGIYLFRKELISQLLRENDVTVLATDTGHREKLEALGCSVVVMDYSRHGVNPLTELGSVKKFRKMIQEQKPDVVLTYTIKPNIYAGMACARLNIPYIENITGLGPAVENGGIIQKVTIPLYRFGMRKAQMVFFQNHENLKFMLDHKMVKGKYSLLPGSGVNLSAYQPLEYPKGKTIDFVFISRIIKEKGIDQYLEAAAFIHAKYPETRFHVCGGCKDPDYLEKLKKLEDNGTIIYHGRVDDIPGMHAVSSCTIHPSYYPEGMSNVLLESCACGRPIITTDRPGCGEIVDDGVNGFVVKQKDSQDLIEKIERFLSLSWEEKKNMGLAGRAKVEREFDRQIVIDSYLREINQIKDL